jgi:hypothetical protein
LAEATVEAFHAAAQDVARGLAAGPFFSGASYSTATGGQSTWQFFSLR